MKALTLVVLAALYLALAFAPAHAAIPARTSTPTSQVTATEGILSSGTAVTILFISGIFLAGVAAALLIRPGRSIQR